MSRTISAESVYSYADYNTPDGSALRADMVELFISLPEDWKLDHWKAPPKGWDDSGSFNLADYNDVDLDYVKWPPIEVDPERAGREADGSV